MKRLIYATSWASCGQIFPFDFSDFSVLLSQREGFLLWCNLESKSNEEWVGVVEGSSLPQLTRPMALLCACPYFVALIDYFVGYNTFIAACYIRPSVSFYLYSFVIDAIYRYL